MFDPDEKRDYVLVFDNLEESHHEWFNEAELQNNMREYAAEFFDDHSADETFSVCVVDFKGQTSSIFEFTCKKTVEIECTAY